MRRIILIFLLAAFIIIQFFRPAKNLSTALAGAEDISIKYHMPDDVNNILKIACNDCHSNSTVYPWYFNIQPVAWWLNDHIRKGKKELNFNEFMLYSARKKFHKMEEIEKEIKENEMPLKSYTIIHRNARLSSHEKQILVQWSKDVREQLKAAYPADSLKKSK